jgi:hypothetical protein
MEFNNNLYKNTITYNYSTKRNIIKNYTDNFNIGKLKMNKTNNSLSKKQNTKKTII